MLFGVDGGLNNQTFHLLYKFKLPAHLSDSQVTGKQFVDSALTGQKLLVSLIERVELTEDKEIIIKFRFAQLDETAESQTPQGIAPSHPA